MIHMQVEVNGKDAAENFATGLFGYFRDQKEIHEFRRRFETFLPALQYANADAKATFKSVAVEPPGTAYWTLADRARKAEQRKIRPLRSSGMKRNDSMPMRLWGGLVGALAVLFGSPQPRLRPAVYPVCPSTAEDGFPRYAAVRLFVEEVRDYDNASIFVGPFPTPSSFGDWESDLRARMQRLQSGFEPRVSSGRIFSPSIDSIKEFLNGALEEAMEAAV